MRFHIEVEIPHYYGINGKFGNVIGHCDIQFENITVTIPNCHTVQYSTVQYSTVQYSTVQYSSNTRGQEYSTVQYSTVQE